jgi:hypothetical protein
MCSSSTATYVRASARAFTLVEALSARCGRRIDVEAFTVKRAYVRDGPSFFFFFPETPGSVSVNAAGG